ncbi:hypothetical protein O3M35_010426 [Rhynocoris fuscipes]|uniref:chitinase n=1 Tax=Rhynocoris fuscipes TaxID=488301 RepID=A0AAW1CYT6_9HEMI
MKYSFIALIFVAFLAFTISQNAVDDKGKKIVCYYANWSPTRAGTAKFTPQNIDPFLCTHLIYAFASFAEGKIVAGDPEQDINNNGFVDFNDLKKVNEKLKTMLSIGGWAEGSAKFSRIASKADRRDRFAQSVVELLRQYNFDGINIDWQYPTFRDGSRPEDRENFVELVKTLRESFDNEAQLTTKPRMLVTMTLPAEKEYIEQGYDLINLQKYIDFFSIVSYDYHLSVEPSINHHAPLYPLPQEIEADMNVGLNADATVEYLLSRGIMKEKLNLGIPTYGRTFKLENSEEHQFGAASKGQGDTGKTNREVGYIPYYEICKKILDEKWTVVQVNTSALGPYAYKGEDWVAYDDENIARTKAEYVRKKGLNGIMFWTIDNDDFRGDCGNRSFPVIKAARDGLRGIPPIRNRVENRPKIPRVGEDPFIGKTTEPPRRQTERITESTNNEPIANEIFGRIWMKAARVFHL